MSIKGREKEVIMANLMGAPVAPLAFSEEEECDPEVLRLLARSERQRKAVYRLIQENPGMDTSEICRLAKEECAD